MKSTPRKGVPSDTIPASVGSTISARMRASTWEVTTGGGEYAPIPPVFGPRSPSKARLWSCAAASGT